MSWGKSTAEPTQITDQIFLGSRRYAANLVVDNPSAIGAVLNVGTGRCSQVDSIDYMHVPILDAGPISRDDLVACLAFIYYHVDRGARVLIHCNAGRNRSAAIAIAHLLVTGISADWNEAFHFVKSKRACVGVRVAIRVSVQDAVSNSGHKETL